MHGNADQVGGAHVPDLPISRQERKRIDPPVTSLAVAGGKLPVELPLRSSARFVSRTSPSRAAAALTSRVSKRHGTTAPQTPEPPATSLARTCELAMRCQDRPGPDAGGRPESGVAHSGIGIDATRCVGASAWAPAGHHRLSRCGRRNRSLMSMTKEISPRTAIRDFASLSQRVRLGTSIAYRLTGQMLRLRRNGSFLGS